MGNDFKKLLGMASGILLGAILYGIGKYLVTGHTDVGHLINNSIACLIGGLIGFLIVTTTRPR
jgi:TRAP-type mannitol/chloroaromatic compound transport system permease large subunit